MENATRALLIAAGILVVIILIALGMLLLKNSNNTSEQAQEVSEQIGDATTKASIDARTGLKELIISKKDFNDFLDKFNKEHPQSYNKEGNGIGAILKEINDKNNKLKDQIKLEGYVYQKANNVYKDENGNIYTDFYTSNGITPQQSNESNVDYFNRMVDIEIPKMGTIKQLTNPQDIDEIREEAWKVFHQINNEPTREEFNNEANKHPSIIRSSWFFHHDDTGYIDEINYIVILYPANKYLRNFCVHY